MFSSWLVGTFINKKKYKENMWCTLKSFILLVKNTKKPDDNIIKKIYRLLLWFTQISSYDGS